MPEIEVRNSYMDPGWIWAIMLFPGSDTSDEALRKALFARQFAQSQIDQDLARENITISTELLRDLIASPGTEEFNRLISERTKRAYVAGELLLYLFGMSQFPRYFPEPSMYKAIFLAREFAKVTTFGDGTKLPSSEQAVRNYFNDFRSVAHLWGAMRLHQSFPMRDSKEVLSSPEAVKDFLGISATLQDFGTSFVPKRAKPAQPILDLVALWQVPKSTTRRYPPWKNPPTWMVETLKKYKSPERGHYD